MAIRLTGFEAASRAFDKAVGKPKRRAMRRAFAAGARIVKKQVKAEAPRASGALKRSIGVKVGQTRGSREAFAVIGVRTNYTESGGGGDRGLRIPNKYYAAIETGTSGRAANPFLRRGLARSKAAAVRKIGVDFGRLYEQLLRRG